MKTTSKTALIATLAITGAFTAGFATGPASAQDRPYRGPFAFDFRYDASELSTLEGAQNMLARLQSVVAAYCGDAPMLTSEERFAVKKCVKRTMSQSIDKFSSTNVAQAFQSRADG